MTPVLLLLTALAISPAEGAALAANDAVQLRQFDPDSLPFTFWLQLPYPTKEDAAAVNLTLNLTVSHSDNIHQAAWVGNKHLLRVDARKLCPDPKDLKNLFTILERLADYDPYYHVSQVVPVKAYQYEGKTYTGKRQSQFALHAGPQNLLLLKSMTGSNLPIMRADWFMARALNTTNGGIYYKLRGIQKSDKNQTAFDKWLLRSGVNLVEYNKINVQNRTALVRSEITGKPRWVEVAYGNLIRPNDAIPIVLVTHDISRAAIDQKFNIFKNLLSAKDEARECFATMPNGLVEMALFNGQGELQDFVPGGIAGDRTIPAPHETELAGMIACIRCHTPDDFYKPLRNDYQSWVKAGYGVEQELSSKLSIEEQQDLINSAFKGNLNIPMKLAADRLNNAIIEATGAIWGVESANSIRLSGGSISTMYNRYTYDLVTPEIACSEFGIPVKEGSDPLTALTAALPKLPPNRFGQRPEGVFEGLLQTPGVGLNRTDFEACFPDYAFRIRIPQSKE